jgi:hypothetical protein
MLNSTTLCPKGDRLLPDEGVCIPFEPQKEILAWRVVSWFQFAGPVIVHETALLQNMLVLQAKECLFVPVACALDRCGWCPLPVGTVIVHHVVLADIFELANLVCIQVSVRSSLPPLVAVLASSEVTLSLA